jgi:hypothetical protein
VTIAFLASLPIVLILASCAILNKLVARSKDEGTLEDAIERSRQLHRGLLRLPDLQEVERFSVFQEIIEAITKNCHFLTCLLWPSPIQAGPKKERKEMADTRAAVMSRTWKLESRARKLLSVLRSNRLSVTSQSIVEVVLEHDQMWSAYSQLLKLQYPDKYPKSASSDEGPDHKSAGSRRSLELCGPVGTSMN